MINQLEKGSHMDNGPKRRSPTVGRREYDFSKGVRGKYAKRYAQAAILIPLAPDVAKDFPNADSVNKALRAYRRILKAIPA